MAAVWPKCKSGPCNVVTAGLLRNTQLVLAAPGIHIGEGAHPHHHHLLPGMHLLAADAHAGVNMHLINTGELSLLWRLVCTLHLALGSFGMQNLMAVLHL